MSSVKKKVGTAVSIFRDEGLGGVGDVLVKDKLGGWWSKVKEWLSKDNWLVGKLIELKGDQVSIDGCRFSVRNTAISTAQKSRFLFNKYEPSERIALQRYLDTSLPVIELGGSVGVVACLTNKKLSDPTRHVVIEANPDLIPLLTSNRGRNNCHFTVISGAVAYGCDQVDFHQNDDFVSSSIQLESARSVTVPAVNLRGIVEQFGFDRFTLICDIEGGEFDLVNFEADILRQRVAMFIVEVHEHVGGRLGVAKLLRSLEEMGFETVFKDWETYVFQNRHQSHARHEQEERVSSLR